MACYVSSGAAEVFDVETNERVTKTFDNMQMPRVEYETITIDDYSACPFTRHINTTLL